MKSATAWGIRWLWANPWLVDGAVALLLLLQLVLPLAMKTPTHGQHASDPAAYLLAVGMSAPFVAHRRAPMSSLAVVLSCLLIYAAVGYVAYPGVNAFVLLFGIALHSKRRRSLVAFAATAVVLAIALLLQPAGVVASSTVIETGLATVIAWLSGEYLRQRRARWVALRERNELLEREREERARQAVMAERLRIARELHDVVAHAMSVIAIQSGVGHHVARTQPAEAERALATIETINRAALVEMRRLLGVLRQEGDTAAATAPAPGLRDVPELIRQVADGGLSARLQITGAPADVPPGVDLSAYRIIQEALTNAIKHGGPNADVTLSYTADDVRLEVTSDASPIKDRGPHLVTAGHGIIGMRERVAVFGGEFSATTRPGGGFRVAARLPFERQPS
jgi:signal transduction histidine kinase